MLVFQGVFVALVAYESTYFNRNEPLIAHQDYPKKGWKLTGFGCAYFSED